MFFNFFIYRILNLTIFKLHSTLFILMKFLYVFNKMPFNVAVENGHTDVVQLLLSDTSFDVNKRNKI